MYMCVNMFLPEKDLEPTLEIVIVHFLVSPGSGYMSLTFHWRSISNSDLFQIVDTKLSFRFATFFIIM